MRPSLPFTDECCPQASGPQVPVLHDPSLFNALAAASALTIAPTALGCTAVSALDHSAHKMPSPWCSMKRQRWKRTMHRRRILYLWAFALALLPRCGREFARVELRRGEIERRVGRQLDRRRLVGGIGFLRPQRADTLVSVGRMLKRSA